MKKFEVFYKSLGEFYELFYNDIIGWCDQNDVLLAISGSSINCNLLEGSDFDFVMIIPDYKLNPSFKLTLPDIINSYNWDNFKKEFHNSHLDIFGTYSNGNHINRIEIYPQSIAYQLLELKSMQIRRLKSTPLDIKNEIFYNIDGLQRVNKIKPIISGDSVYSSTFSIIQEDENIFWGMHIERLFLSQTIFGQKNDFGFMKRKLLGLIWKKSIQNETEISDIIKNIFYLTSNNPKIIPFINEEFTKLLKKKQ